MESESGFLAAADSTLAAIGAALDRALDSSEADVDWSLVDGILEIACEDGSKVIVNRHAPNREIWVAARRGGYHFRSEEGRWRDTRGGGELGASLSAILRVLAGLAVALAAVSLGVMAAFALVFAPPLLAWRFARGWRSALALAALIGVGGYTLAFALSLGLDQPFGPVCALLLVMLNVSAGVKFDRM